MKNKFYIQTLDEETGEVISNYPAKNFYEIATLLDMDYFQARKLYQYCKKPTKAHSLLMNRAKRFRIIDNPEIGANIQLPL